MRKVYVAASGLLLATALAACAPVKPVNKDDGAIVERRALERWNLLIAHQAEKAYDYLTPGYRLTMSRDKYATRMNDTAVRWKKVQSGGHSCQADTCTVTVLVDVLVPMQGVSSPQGATMPVEEHWIKADNVWYFFPDWNMKPLPADAGEPSPRSPGDASKHLL